MDLSREGGLEGNGKKRKNNKNKKGRAGGKVEHEEIQVGWCLESETVQSSHWQVFFSYFP